MKENQYSICEHEECPYEKCPWNMTYQVKQNSEDYNDPMYLHYPRGIEGIISCMMYMDV